MLMSEYLKIIQSSELGTTASKKINYISSIFKIMKNNQLKFLLSFQEFDNEAETLVSPLAINTDDDDLDLGE